MLEAYSVNQTVPVNGVIPFTSVSLIKGTTAILSGAGSIQLNKCGVYSICMILSATPSEAGTATIEMTKNGVVQPQATSTVAGVAVASGVVMPVCTLVQVSENNSNCCCTSPTVIQFINIGVGLTDADAKVVVTKLC